MKRVLVDMSATLLHHGHVRLIKAASLHGKVIVALTTDDEILKMKGYQPELKFEERKEIIKSLRHVDEVIASPWRLNQSFLDLHQIDLLVHGEDNSNTVDADRLLIFPRTVGISSTELRKRATRALSEQTKRPNE